MLKTFISAVLLLTVPYLLVSAQTFTVSSPDGGTIIQVNTENGISWSVTKYGQAILPEIVIDLVIDGESVVTSGVRNNKIEQVDKVENVLIPTKNDQFTNRYNELQLRLRDRTELLFRAYDDGVAYRFVLHRKKETVIDNERMDIHFPEGATSLFPLEESTYSHNERLYIPTLIDTLKNEQFASLPALFATGDIKILFSEADVFNYPQLFIKGGPGNMLSAMHPPVVAESRPADGPSGDRNVVIVREEPFIASIEGESKLPWRFFLISREEKDFLNQDMVLQLSRGNLLENTSWIKPGKVAWDWYNANNLYGVDFEAGLNTATYKYYIDFAAANKIEYVILDEGWTKSTLEILEFNPEIDVAELIRYGRERNVGIILWCLWKPLDENMVEILDTYAGWGAKGIKVDFMQRGDQYMTRSYEMIAKACAERELLVDFHGAFKPGGMRRAYPNIINYEGVKGNENHKWSHDVTPRHNTTLPFIRMAVGPMDYTPGAMRNYHLADHPISHFRPASIGTRAHQAALYMIFESPLQMLCDAPTAYEEEQETTDYIAAVPVTWNETVPLAGRVGEFVAVARRHGDTWYIGAITNEEPREMDIDLSFLGDGEYDFTIFKDGLNAGTFAEDYEITRETHSSKDKLTISMATGGGWSAVIVKK